MVIELLTGEMAAGQLSAAFFAVYRHLAPHTDDEMRISRTLQKAVTAAYEHRNDVAHGEWFIGWGAGGAELPDDPTLVRTKPGRKDFAIRSHDYTVAEMDAWSDDLHELRRALSEYAFRTVPMPGFDPPPISVGEVYVVKGGKVLREGPRASEAGEWFGW